jgi:transposase
MAKELYKIVLDDNSRKKLEVLLSTQKTEKRMVERAKIILLSSEGKSVANIAKKLDCSTRKVCAWKKRYCQHGINGLSERQRSGRPVVISNEALERVITRAVGNARHMSCRKMAREVGISHSSVQRIWVKNEIKPHLTRTFKVSNDPRFEEKFWDVIGLYLDPPEQAIVLCCDEKSQIQALERSQPGLPLGIGHIKTQTHDYYRHGTMTLFAALNYLDGKIISRTEEKHRHSEWLKFLKQIHKENPGKLDIHIILDNYSTHKHKAVIEWLAKHPRFHLHFTPTSASWMNLVERFFRDIQMDVVKDSSFKNLNELNEALKEHISSKNASPSRYVWKAEGSKILEKISRAKQALLKKK